ncbi:MAG TPA: hypothetical protein VGV35_20025, partial [Bryobacteraceae bacterium]|nr:hypothetical protein [Bryobacteraceae bacterium]
VYSVLYFFNALAPVAIPGGGTDYLASVARWWHDHGWGEHVWSRLSGIPPGLGMLFLVAFSIGKHSAAALVHFTFLAALPCLLLCYGRRFGMARPFILGAMLVYLSPIAGVAGTSAYYYLAAASVLFGLFYVLQIWDEVRNPRLLVLAALLAVFGGALTYASIPGVFHLQIRKLPALWSLSGESVQGLFGPWLMLTPVALVAVRWKHGRRLLLAAAICAVAALVNNSTRFLLPAAVFAAPALGMAVQNSPGILPLLLALHSFVSWPNAVGAFAGENAWRITGMPVAAALRRVPQDEYLKKRVAGYDVACAIEKVVPDQARVLTLLNVPQMYTSRRLAFAESDDGKRAVQAIQAGYRSMAIPLREIRFRFPEQAVQALRVVRVGGSSEAWSVAEMRVYRADAELERQGPWRVTAKPDAFDAPRAFDNSEVTSWPAWEVAETGMYLEEDFAGEIRVDSVMLVSSPAAFGLRVDGLGADGRWKTLAGQAETVVHPTPAGLRRAAREELKSLGFSYVVARNNDEAGTELKRNAPYWGITPVREVGGACVYRLD